VERHLPFNPPSRVYVFRISKRSVSGADYRADLTNVDDKHQRKKAVSSAALDSVLGKEEFSQKIDHEREEPCQGTFFNTIIVSWMPQRILHAQTTERAKDRGQQDTTDRHKTMPESTDRTYTYVPTLRFSERLAGEPSRIRRELETQAPSSIPSSRLLRHVSEMIYQE